MLAIASLRRMMAFALVPRCRAAVLAHTLPASGNHATFDNIGGWWTSIQSRNVSLTTFLLWQQLREMLQATSVLVRPKKIGSSSIVRCTDMLNPIGVRLPCG